jgi:hypothetical protein
MIEDISHGGPVARFFLAERAFFDRLDPAGLQIHFGGSTAAPRGTPQGVAVPFGRTEKEAPRLRIF